MEFHINEQPFVYREFLMYMQSIKGKSFSTVKEYASDLNIFFLFMKEYKLHEKTDSISDLDYSFVETIELIDLYAYLTYMADERKNTASSRARKVACLRSYFKYMASKAKHIKDNPAKELDSPKIKQSLPRYLTLDESKQLLSAVEGENKYRDYAILTLFLNCGLRLSELVGININDFKDDVLIVTGKGNKERVIYLNDACIAAVRNYMRVRPTDGVIDKNALFLSKRLTRISNKTVQWLVKKHIKDAGLDDTKYSVHKLRHTAATLMYKYAETDLRTLQEILGHNQLATTQIYTHIDDEQRRNAVKNNPLASLNDEE
ncbi:MAG: tyrosine recombinase XerC [Clostridia bacterium]|nr:tyrosine recombinase XerC [Clostridia bacterium]